MLLGFFAGVIFKNGTQLYVAFAWSGVHGPRVCCRLFAAAMRGCPGSKFHGVTSLRLPAHRGVLWLAGAPCVVTGRAFIDAADFICMSPAPHGIDPSGCACCCVGPRLPRLLNHPSPYVCSAPQLWGTTCFHCVFLHLVAYTPLSNIMDFLIRSHLLRCLCSRRQQKLV